MGRVELPVFSVVGLALHHMRFPRTLDEEVGRALGKVVDASRGSHRVMYARAAVEAVFSFVHGVPGKVGGVVI